MAIKLFALGLFGLAATGAVQVQAQPRAPNMRLGSCVRTTIRQVMQRLEDGETRQVIPDSGSAVAFANGLYQVSYDQIAAVNASRAGDPVRICLRSMPIDCPLGDDRGKIYRTTNLRTRQSWTLPDSGHGCGGA